MRNRWKPAKPAWFQPEQNKEESDLSTQSAPATQRTYEPTAQVEEQAILDAIKVALSAEIETRERRYQEARRRYRTGLDPASGTRLELLAAQSEQARAISDGEPPYFARVRGELTDTRGKPYSLDVRVHQFSHQDRWPSPAGEILSISHRTGIGELVRNPGLGQFIQEDREVLLTGTITVHEAYVEDIEIVDGVVRRASPRYTAVYEDRVRDRMLRVGNTSLSNMASVLSPAQNAILSSAGDTRVFVLRGPAGTGKTAVALHRIALLAAEDEPILYVTPTPALADYVRPAFPGLGLARFQYEVLSIWDILKALVPELKGNYPFYDDEAPLARGKGLPEPGGIMPYVYREYDEALGKPLHEARSLLGTLVVLLKTRIEDADMTFRRIPVEISGLEYRFNLDDFLAGRDVGLPGEPTEQYRAIFRSLMDFAQRDPVAASLLNREALDKLLEKLEPNLVKIYFAAAEKFARDLTPSGGKPPVLQPRIRREDIPALILLALHAGRRLSTNPKWVVIDEGQSLSPLGYQALRRLVPEEARFVITGDMNQQTRPELGIGAWEEAVSALGFGPGVYVDMTLDSAYRTPPAIHEAAFTILGAHAETRAEPSELHPEKGSVRVVHAFPNELPPEVAAAASGFLRDGLATVVVICPSLRDARNLMGQVKRALGKDPTTDTCYLMDGSTGLKVGVAFTTVDAVAGIEADAVCVTDIDNKNYPDTALGARRLHTACTRARKVLTLIAVGEQSRIEAFRNHDRRLRAEYRLKIGAARKELDKTTAVATGDDLQRAENHYNDLVHLANQSRYAEEVPDGVRDTHIDSNRRLCSPLVRSLALRELESIFIHRQIHILADALGAIFKLHPSWRASSPESLLAEIREHQPQGRTAPPTAGELRHLAAVLATMTRAQLTYLQDVIASMIGPDRKLDPSKLIKLLTARPE